MRRFFWSFVCVGNIAGLCSSHGQLLGAFYLFTAVSSLYYLVGLEARTK
jgi:hypothetical protein